MADRKQISAHKFDEMYADMGYDLGELGCIMLDLDPLKFQVAEEALHYSKTAKYAQGNVAGDTPHITLLYGLVRSGREMKRQVDIVLKDALPKLKTITIDHVGYFENTMADDPYYCIVAHIKVTPELQEAHDLLTFLPHIETFTGPYKPHFTLCYIKKNVKNRDIIIKKMNEKYSGRELKVGDLNYGGNH